jgi:hypothetical protein
MRPVADLPAKLAMVLAALSISRVSLAQRLAVDKSVIGRWLGGTVHPTEHNLARLSAIIAEHLPGFALADWHLDSAQLAERYSLPLSTDGGAGGPIDSDPFFEFLQASPGKADSRARCYEGFWRTSRPSLLKAGEIFHDYGIIHRRSDGVVEVRMAGSGLDFSGRLVAASGNVFVFLYDPVGRSPLTVLCKGVSLPRAMVLDGILLLAALDSDRTPVAMPIVIERLGDLGDSGEDNLARFRSMADERPLPLEPLAEDRLRARLFRNTGPAAAAAGDEAFLNVAGGASLSRGSTGLGLDG